MLDFWQTMQHCGTFFRRFGITLSVYLINAAYLFIPQCWYNRLLEATGQNLKSHPILKMREKYRSFCLESVLSMWQTSEFVQKHSTENLKLFEMLKVA
jgi:hypothetical protein